MHCDFNRFHAMTLERNPRVRCESNIFHTKKTGILNTKLQKTHTGHAILILIKYCEIMKATMAVGGLVYPRKLWFDICMNTSM